jgi:aminopeptidase N
MRRHLPLFISFTLLILLACQAIVPAPTPTPTPPTTVITVTPRPTATLPPIKLTQIAQRTQTIQALMTQVAQLPAATPNRALTAAAQTVQAYLTRAPTATADTTRVEIPAEQLSAGDPYMPEIGNQGYDVAWYRLALILDPQRASLSGRVTITATTTAALSALSLDFVGFEIDTLAVNGVPANYQRQGKKLLVALPQPLAAAAPFQVQIAYHGRPAGKPSPYVPFVPALGLIYNPQANVLFAAAEPDGARNWFPCNDHPRDKASYRFELTVPQGLTAVANGVLVSASRSPQGDTFTWEHQQPIATAFVTVAVGPFERVESASPAGVPLRSYVLPKQAAAYRAQAAAIGEMVDWLGGMLGPYPFDEFGYVSAPGLGASLETQTIVLLGTDEFDDSTLVHEMAHQWFGDWVSLDSWGEIWRSEGFATYMAYLWSNRANPAGLESEMDTLAQSLQDYPASFPLNNPPPAEMFGAPSYYGGAVLAHQLRQTVGDAAFFAGLKLYFERYGGGSASDADFQAAMEETSGKSLDDFFAIWFK